MIKPNEGEIVDDNKSHNCRELYLKKQCIIFHEMVIPLIISIQHLPNRCAGVNLNLELVSLNNITGSISLMIHS